LAISASDIKFIRSLQQKKFRKEHGLFVVEGVKPVSELLDSSLEVERVYATESDDFGQDSVQISAKELGRISVLKSPNKMLALAKIPTQTNTDWSQNIILFLDGIGDPGNLGTIIRTAKWFGITEIVCSGDCVDAYDRKVVQSTMGALFHVNLVYSDSKSALKSSKQNGFTIIGTAMNGTSVYELNKPEKTILVIGSESQGMRKDVANLCDDTCSIPNLEKEQKIESLNAGIATAIVLSELTRKASN
jgi:TrmH family RNA methyltransferase